MFIKNRLAIIAVCLLFVFGLSGCDTNTDPINTDLVVGEYPVTVADLELKSQPKKVLVLSASLADVIVAIGAEVQLTAVSSDCTLPELEVLPKVSANDKDAIAATAADLIIIDAADDDQKAVLAGVTTPILAIELASSREDFERLYVQMGAAMFGDGYGYDKGMEVARDILTTLDDVERETGNRDVVTTACYLYDTKGHAVTGEEFGSIIMELSGLTNVFKNDTGGKYELSRLELSNPNIIFCAPGMKSQIESNSNFAGLSAVLNKKVYELDEMYMEWQGYTVTYSAAEIAGKAFPDLMDDVSQAPTDPTSKIESAVEDELSSQLSSAPDKVESSSYETMSEGESGDDVKRLQERLDELGYLETEYDGTFGTYTADALKAFQKKNDLEETGVADSKTQAKLYASDAVKKDA